MKNFFQNIISNIIAAFILTTVLVLILAFANPKSLTIEIVASLCSAFVITVIILLILMFKNRSKQKSIISKVLDSGIQNIFFSRDELYKYLSIGDIFDKVAKHSEIFIVARSALSWANEFKKIEKAIVDKCIRITIVMADPDTNSNHLPIIKDYGKFDLKSTLEKLNKIEIANGNSGSLDIYLIPTFVLSSFVYFIDSEDGETGILEFGADMSLDNRPTICCKKGHLLAALVKIYKKIIVNRTPINLKDKLDLLNNI